MCSEQLQKCTTHLEVDNWTALKTDFESLFKSEYEKSLPHQKGEEL